MEPPRGFLASLWNFIRFLPYFIGLLILGTIKGVILCPFILVIVTVGNSAIVLGLWPVHLLYSFYCVLSAKQIGPVLKLVSCICLPIILFLWLLIAIASSIVGGAAFGFLSPMLATFRAIDLGKPNKLYHCIYDGTWDTVKGSCTIVRDVGDICYHSYFSVMDDLRIQKSSTGKYYEIRLLYLPVALFYGLLGSMVDMLVITAIAAYKSPYMLIKGWYRLFHDCIGREGPFLETICVPFAGLAILLWPLAVVGAFLGSIVSSIVLGAYAGVILYQESSFWYGICYIVASISIYDEYSNDILDMREGYCFPRPTYRAETTSRTNSRAGSFSKSDSLGNPPNRSNSMNTSTTELKASQIADAFFEACRCNGEILASEGVITRKDFEDAKSSRDNGKTISIGLPAYCFLQVLLRSAKANSAGLLLNDNTEITSTNRPKDSLYDWFFNPLLTMKEQIKAGNLSESEEKYLGRLILLGGDPESLKNSNIGSPPESELRRAELEALARRLRGITKSISRFLPTFKRRFDSSMKSVLDELAKKNGESRKCEAEGQSIRRSKSMFVKIFSQKSFKDKRSNTESDQEEAQMVGNEGDTEIK
ncbi:uncharacterized membrane protein At3g27390-like [Ipomoea triloba]|uniref:uncharacterized membrane protein At3g27390-like n=1 Tax=Ipomoea triloba TaxID=35885 RepID=UPI00125DB774|nr:uncharacterized membrane protein At3g27390-like [Ipomoea triloba]